MPERPKLSESLGDYLETIYHLVRKNKVARVKEIAEGMHVHMSSVTGALKSLTDKRLVNHDPYGLVTLTPLGEAAGKEVVRRHQVLSEFFEKVLDVDVATAERNACHLEHAIEPQVLNHLVEFLEERERNTD